MPSSGSSRAKRPSPARRSTTCFAATIDKVHKPVFARIEFEHDLAARRGRFSVKGLIEAVVEPIRNPVTGAEHRVRVVLPDGFEYHEAEFASSRILAPTAAVPLDWRDRHGFLAAVEMTGAGVVR